MSHDAAVLNYPLPVLAAHRDLVGLAVPGEFVDVVAEALARCPDDGFTARMRHLLGPLSVVLQMAHFEPDYAAVQSFVIWRNVPRPKALALAHIVGELLFVAGHTAVAVALIDSQERGVAFRFTSTGGHLVARSVVGLAPAGRVA